MTSTSSAHVAPRSRFNPVTPASRFTPANVTSRFNPKTSEKSSFNPQLNLKSRFNPVGEGDCNELQEFFDSKG
jgi:hypothetical protein